MWRVAQALDEYDIPLEAKRRLFYAKKHRGALEALDNRMQQLADSLNSGLPLRSALSRNWIHAEPAGMFAVCHFNPVLRLYFVPLPESRVLLTLNIGDKKRQGEDIREAVEWAKAFLAGE